MMRMWALILLINVTVVVVTRHAVAAVPSTTLTAQYDYYHSSTQCIGDKASSIPFVVSDQCNTFFNQGSYKVTCSNAGPVYNMFNSGDCSGPAMPNSVECESGEQEELPASAISCQSYPTNKLIKYMISIGSCVGKTLNQTAPIAFSLVYVLDSCQSNRDPRSPKSKRVVLGTDNKVRIAEYNGFTCSGAGRVTEITAFDECVEFDYGSGRQLSSSSPDIFLIPQITGTQLGAIFTPAVPGAKLEPGPGDFGQDSSTASDLSQSAFVILTWIIVMITAIV